MSENYEAEKNPLICPICGKEMRELNWGWSCTGYNDHTCDFKISKEIAQKKITENQARKIAELKDSGLIKGFVSKKGNTFDAHLIIKDGKVDFQYEKFDEPIIGPSGNPVMCPVCGEQLVSKQWGWGCSGYRTSGCKFTVNRVMLDKRLTDGQMERIIRNGDSGLITGFVSKKGNTFDAHLKLHDDGKIGFDFENSKKVN